MSTRVMNPNHRRVALGKGCNTAAGGTRETAPSVDTAVPPQGYARARHGGTCITAGRKYGEEDSPDPIISSPDPTASSQNPKPSSRRWSRVNGARIVGHWRKSPLRAAIGDTICAPLVDLINSGIDVLSGNQVHMPNLRWSCEWWKWWRLIGKRHKAHPVVVLCTAWHTAGPLFESHQTIVVELLRP